MAKQYLVDHTVQFKDKSGKAVSILRSDKPQDIPASIVKEALARKLIRSPEGSEEDAPAPPVAPPPEGGTGDGRPGTGEDK